MGNRDSFIPRRRNAVRDWRSLQLSRTRRLKDRHAKYHINGIFAFLSPSRRRLARGDLVPSCFSGLFRKEIAPAIAGRIHFDSFLMDPFLCLREVELLLESHAHNQVRRFLVESGMC